MGLSGVKKRSKLSTDPNNTTWAKSTTNFGHKILSKQGWKPGDFLGAENANHSDHYTAANASHIRVMLREDNLGLGAKIGGGNAETFGLSMFSGLLGRLNGKSDVEVKEKQDKMRDAELRTYTGRKYGYMNFVSGGLLVGDKMEEKPAAAEAARSSKKRKAEDDINPNMTVERKKSHRTEPEVKQAVTSMDLDEESSAAGKQKSKKDKKKRKVESSGTQESNKDGSDSSSQSEDAAKEEKRKRKERRKAEKAAKRSKGSSEDEKKACMKQERRARKEERRKRKEEKRQKRAAKEAEKQQASASSSEEGGTATPPVVSNAGGRQAVRQRYIQSKRMASMDPQALKEIFMLQAKAAA